jgi:hypothetical protein
MAPLPALHFDVQLSEPYEYQGTNGPTLSRRNLQYDIITTTAQRAIELVLQQHPQGIVHVVQRRGTGRLIFDPELNLGATEDASAKPNMMPVMDLTQ